MTFYTQIPPIDNISQIIDPAHYYDVPADWYIAATDVKGSTQAVANGNYKEVNAVAAASITALLNLAPNQDLPFVFGGDGATILVPPHILTETKQALVATRKMAKDQFNLTLRVGIIPVKDVLVAGHRIRVARLQMSDNFQQAIFSGGGLTFAETLLKTSQQYILDEIDNPVADFSGFECRWNPIPSRYEETISLMIMALEDEQVYAEVLNHIQIIYGDAAQRHPIIKENLHLALRPDKLSVESRVRKQTRHWKQLFKMWQGSLKAWIAMRFNIQGWGRYKDIFLGATDHEKFDDTLRMTISGTKQQRQRLEEKLNQLYQQKRLVYGIHASQRALVTCIVFDYFGRQVHFVDGEDGGYTLAARQMKERLNQLSGH
ncbi:MAG: DUF3095 domain-containing protein [Chloroflexi bacterium]|nr:MAG: DUF3095 domain-containing protein [Chloroflexota bacterium]